MMHMFPVSVFLTNLSYWRRLSHSLLYISELNLVGICLNIQIYIPRSVQVKDFYTFLLLEVVYKQIRYGIVPLVLQYIDVHMYIGIHT